MNSIDKRFVNEATEQKYMNGHVTRVSYDCTLISLCVA